MRPGSSISIQYAPAGTGEQQSTDRDDSPASLQQGVAADGLYCSDNAIGWYLTGISAYAFAGIGFAVYLTTCPIESPGSRAIISITSNINQFYSGLALSALLTPAAIMIRMLAYNLALLHPFAISATKRTNLKDLDILMEPGFNSMIRLFKYSTLTAMVQAFLLLAGAVLIPVGTLIAYTGVHSSPTNGYANVGAPVANDSIYFDPEIIWSLKDGYSYVVPHDLFLEEAIQRFQSEIIKSPGVISLSSQQLGPSSTTNFTYKEDHLYEGIVTFNWSSGCHYTSKIEYVERPSNEDTNEVESYGVIFLDESQRDDFLLPDARNIAVGNGTDGTDVATVYYAVAGLTYNTIDIENAKSAQEVDSFGELWITRVACEPSLTPLVSKCIWRNSSMSNCVPAPSATTVELGVAKFNLLARYMNLLPLRLDADESWTFGEPTILAAVMFDPLSDHPLKYRVPSLSDFDKMYGLIAQSIVAVATSGYYGSVEVPVTGTKTTPVYLVRTYILGIIVGTLALVPLLAKSILLWRHRCNVPMRRATFLTVANAVRGKKWDSILRGGDAMSHSELLKMYAEFKVMYGVDPDSEGLVGFFRRCSADERMNCSGEECDREGI